MNKGRVIEPAEWAGMPVPDVYFSYEYYCASGAIEPDFSKTILLEFSDDNGSARLPLIIRQIPGTEYFDATSAYGYGGPWTEGAPDPRAFLEFLDRWANENSVVCSFLRFHPILDNARNFLDTFQVRTVGLTAGWEIRSPRDLIAGMSKDHRKNWRRAGRAGVETRVTPQPQNIDAFINLYNMSMDRLSANSFYRFSDDYWKFFTVQLRKQTVLVEAVFAEKTVASALCLIGKDLLHYHLSGTSDEGRKLGGAVVCRVAAAQWGQDNGLTVAHSGGGVGGTDSPLLAWKHKFDESQPLFNFSVSNLIHDSKTYEEISSSYPDDDFFPAWRNPKVQKQI